VAAFPDHGLTAARKLFTSAQAALKTAKAKGRNQCLLHQEVRAKADQVGAASDAVLSSDGLRAKWTPC
jgi:hypothetical protein